MGKRQAGVGCVVLWATFTWDTFGAAIQVDDTLIHATYINITAEKVHLLEQYSLLAVASLSWIMHPATMQKWFKNDLRKASLSC